MTDLPPDAFGPAALGRGVVVDDPAHVPVVFADAPTYVLDDRALDHPGPLAQALHHHWARREPVVVVLAVDNAALRQPEVTDLPPWELGPSFAFERERLAHRVWANNYDLRSGSPVWWRGVVAVRHTPLEEAPDGVVGDAVLPGTRDGVWVDGGPRGPVLGVGQPLIHRESVELLQPRRTTVLGNGDVDADLDPDQRRAAAHPAPMARVLAPAGSGKTRVLTARLRHLLDDRRFESGLVTAVAYNKRAQLELAERVGDDRAHVRTVHSLAYAICREAGIRTVLDEGGVRSVLESLVRVARIPNTDPYQPWFEAMAQVRLELRSPAEVEASRDDVPDFAAVFARYREELGRRNAVDFDEQVTRAIELLCSDTQLRARWQARCTHLLVDELQDVTPAFVLLLRLLALPDLQVFGVGDDDQVIYGHAGADPSFLLDLDLLVPGVADLRLGTNYRCPPDVVDAAATLLGHNQERVAKTIGPAPGRGDAGLVVRRAATTDVAATVVEAVRTQLDDGAVPADVAVLARVNAALLPFQVALHEAGIATSAPLGPTTLRRTGIRAAFAYLELATRPNGFHRSLVYETVNRPARQLRSALGDHLQRRDRWTITDLEALAPVLTDSQADRLWDYVSDLRLLADMAGAGADTATLLQAIGDDVGLGEAMSLLDSSSRHAAGSAHTDDLAALQQLAVHHPDPATFSRWLRDALEVRGAPDGVQLSSIHRVKGLEWDHVVVAPVADGLVPHRLAEDVEEERRVLHVAVTRGRRSVTVVVDRERPGPFAAQLSTPADEPGGAAHGDLAALASQPVPDQPAQAVVDGDAVVAARGLRLGLPGGAACVVDDVSRRTQVAIGRLLRAGDATDARVHVVLRDHPTLAATPVELAGRWTTLCTTAPARRTTSSGDRRRQPTLDGSAPSTDDQIAAARPEVQDRFEALRSWRRDRANDDGVPAYVVFDNKTLLHVAERDPDDEAALLRVPGVGPTKLERYADEVLEVLADLR